MYVEKILNLISGGSSKGGHGRGKRQAEDTTDFAGIEEDDNSNEHEGRAEV